MLREIGLAFSVQPIRDPMKILVIEDDGRYLERYQSAFQGISEVFTAVSMRDARILLKSHPDIKVVILDGLVPLFTGETGLQKTTGLVREIALRCPGAAVIAASSDDSINAELLGSEATYSIHNKDESALLQIITKLNKTAG